MFGYGLVTRRVAAVAGTARATRLADRGVGRAGLATSSSSRDGLLTRWHELAERELSMLQDEMQRFLPVLPVLWPSTLSRASQAAKDGEREFFDSMTGTGDRSDIKKSEKSEQATEKSSASTPGDANSSYSSYSFSYSAVLDKEGQRVLASTKRRRYEDSTGRLKAIHERVVGDGAKKLTSTWTRPGAPEERPQCKMTVEGCESEEEFERSWAQTAFAQGQGGQEAERRGKLGSGSQPQTSAQQAGDGERGFGPDVDAAQAAPEKKASELGDGVTQEARNKSRADAIAEGSRRQEEETTPPM